MKDGPSDRGRSDVSETGSSPCIYWADHDEMLVQVLRELQQAEREVYKPEFLVERDKSSNTRGAVPMQRGEKGKDSSEQTHTHTYTCARGEANLSDLP